MTFAAIVNNIVAIINYIVIPLIFAIAGAAFLWGVVQYFFIGGDNAEKQAAGRTFVLWSIVAMMVILSTWGLVNLLLTTFGI